MSSSSSSPAAPGWLKSLPLAPEFRPSDTEFSDPIAFISRIEREASAFGICKIIPPTPTKSPSKKFALSNLSRSLGPTPFTTRHQQLGQTRNTNNTRRQQQVWQSGEFYSLDQFETKSRTFSKSYLHTSTPVPALSVETLFWKAASEKPIYIEYANDLPGSGFSSPPSPRKRRRREFLDTEPAGLSNSPWNLQAIARAPGSLTRFMPDDIPGVTSPMVYVAMLFSWFAWHVEDHELHSLNFLHVGAAKTWYAVPGDRAEDFEEAVRVRGYGADVDRLEAFRMLGEKTTLLSPEVVVASGIPCCRLVQNPGEFVVTFPRAYHIGFSHGFNCGEAANFATPQWLKVAKEAAVRRAAMGYLPMLSHQQLLYILTMSFVTRVPRALLSGVRSSRLEDRKREEREILVKRAFLNDIMTENNLLCVLLSKESTSYAVLWEPDLLPSPCTVPQSHSIVSFEAQGSGDNSDGQGREKKDGCVMEKLTGSPAGVPQTISSIEEQKNACCLDSSTSDEKLLEGIDSDEDDLPVGLKIDSGSLPCVACGILGYPFMAVVQPSALACKELFPVSYEQSHQNIGNSSYSGPPSCLPSSGCKFEPEKSSSMLGEQANPDSIQKSSSECDGRVPIFEGNGKRNGSELPNSDVEFPNLSDGQISVIGNVHFSNKSKKIEKSYGIDCLKELKGRVNMTDRVVEVDSCTSSCGMKPFPEIDKLHDTVPRINTHHSDKNSSISNFLRPRIFCLEHALEIEELLKCKGGAHVLIICHSDYVKIKAYGMSVAEEVRMQFNFEEVPLGSASPSDLDLINIAIGDEEHDEPGEDWTSKLGMNLRYSVKARSQSVSKQKRLSIVLGRLFSNNLPLSVFSTLKWQRRKLRTPYKVVGTRLSKSFIDVNTEKSGSIVRSTNGGSPVKLQVYQSRRRKSASKYFGHLGESIPIGMGGSNGSAAVDDMESCQKPVQIHHLDEKVGVDKPDELFTVLVSATEDLQMYEDSCLPVVTSNLEKVSDPCRFKFYHQDVNLPILETSEMHQEISSAQDNEGWCSSRTSVTSECQVNSVERKASYTEVQQQTGSVAETNPGCEFNNHTSQGASGIVQDTLMSGEVNLDGNLCNSLLPDNQSHDNSGVQPEISVAEKPNMVVRVDHSSKAKKRFSVKEFDTKCKVGSSEKPESQGNVLEPEINVSDVQLKATATVVSSSQQECHNSLDSSRGSETFQDTSKLQETGLDESLSNSLLSVEESPAPLLSHDNPEMQLEVSTAETPSMHSTSERNKELVGSVNPVLDNRSVSTANTIASFVSMEAELKTMGGLKRCNRNLSSVGIKAYFRRRYKRKREEEQEVPEVHPSCKSFIRGPCEGLRPRSRLIPEPEIADTRIMEKKTAASVTKRLGEAKKLGKDENKRTHMCDIKGCRMGFRTRGELQLHMQNRCTKKKCRKQFKSHKNAIQHQRVHIDVRPLKCPWKGCEMSFKWDWSRTEHMRIHTGERPYKCSVVGCGMTFRFVSAFSSHRRKTGHTVNSTDG